MRDEPNAAPGGAFARGIAYLVGADLIWGSFPLYLFPLSGKIEATTLLSQRVVWSVLLGCVIVTASRGWGEIRAAVTNPRTFRTLLLSAALISGNWFTFGYVSTHGQVMQASLGYFITPLVGTLLGMVFLGERLRPLQWAAVALAAAGVIYLSVRLGVVPQAALFLAGCFGLYGLVRKTAPVNPLAGVVIENAIVFLPAAAYLAYAAKAGVPGGRPSPGMLAYLAAGSSLFTVLPLLWFNKAAKLLPLATVAFMHYFVPSCQFLFAVLLFREAFTRTHAVSFGLIWLAVGLFLADMVRSRRSARGPEPALAAAEAQA